MRKNQTKKKISQICNVVYLNGKIKTKNEHLSFSIDYASING